MNVQEFIGQLVGAKWSTDELTSDPAVGVAAVRVVTNNARRFLVELTNVGPTTITVARFLTVTTSTGRLIAPGDTYTVAWYDQLDQVARELWAISSAAGGQLHVREVVNV